MLVACGAVVGGRQDGLAGRCCQGLGELALLPGWLWEASQISAQGCVQVHCHLLQLGLDCGELGGFWS